MRVTAPCDPYAALRPLMERCGATGTPKEFHGAVNRAYHAAEAARYDELHADMFEGLGPVWERLLGHAGGGGVRVLDVGAGTGLVGGVLRDVLGAGRVRELVLLDPAPEMLAAAARKAEGWGFPCRCVEGDLGAIGDGERFDLVTANSVLHHIVELEAFCARAGGLLADRGLLLTAQDPRAGAGDDAVFRRRRDAARRARRRPLALRAAVALKRALVGRRPSPVAEATNAALLARGAIAAPLDREAIWAVTDFHVPDQPGGFGAGIDAAALARWLPGLVRADLFTYQFHGQPWTLLTAAERERERAWLAADDPHGQLLATAWRRPAR